MNGGLKFVMGILILAGLALLLGLVGLIPLSSGGESFLGGVMAGCSIGIAASWVITWMTPKKKKLSN
jgi:hypothetical protein